MRRRKKIKTIIMIVLISSISALSIGFAAFSNTLVIKSTANIGPNANGFKVQFSSDETEISTGLLFGSSSTGATSAAATINETQISNLTASFTGPGQSVTYTFYSHNIGEYDAYLKKINFENINNENSSKVCTAKDESNTSAALVKSACADISVSVKVGDTETTTSIDNLMGHSLKKKNSEKITVVILYENNNNNSDGDFEVEFGDISLVYSSSP